ncbi:MAG: hypothetical protein LC791_10285 [Acidobacteria bacterium]|nr:hypothetical protein [Acidobacteriota bacterium]
MRVPSVVTAGLGCLAIGTALYLSRAVLDRIVVDERSTRVAFLPAWPAWAGFVLVAVLAVWWLSRVGRRSPRGEDGRRPSIGTVMLPSLALVTLTLPYWPWLPDRLPVIQMLAGPGRALVWLAVIGQMVWVVMQARAGRTRWLHRVSLDRATALVIAGTIAAAGLAATQLTSTVLFPAGDEPHYLVIAQSLWRDGDLAIENNHGNAEYREGRWA